MNPDLQLQEQVVKELKAEPRIDASHIRVSVRDGVVVLCGHISSYAERYAAETAVRRVHGVKAVADELDIKLLLPVDRHHEHS